MKDQRETALLQEIKNLETEFIAHRDREVKLFDEASEGFAVCELIFDDNEKPVDYRFLMMNPAFEKHTGLKVKSTIGRTVKDIYPDIEQAWIDNYGSVVINQKSIQFIDYNHNTKKWYCVNAYPISVNDQ